MKLVQIYPVVCDSLFHGSTLSKRFFKRFWPCLALSKQDYVQSHDCYELLYKRFTQWQHAPSTSLLPLPMEGFYPVEPYLAWRIASLFLHHSDHQKQMELTFYANPHVMIFFEFELKLDRLTFITITEDDDQKFVAYNEDDWSQSQHVNKLDILALVFELLMMPWYIISGFGVEFEERMILQVDSKHKLTNYPGEFLEIRTHNGM